MAKISGWNRHVPCARRPGMAGCALGVRAAASSANRRPPGPQPGCRTPDVIIAFLDDHFENHFRSLMPTVGIGVADSHPGPATQWLEALRLTRQERFGSAPRLPNGCCGRWSPMDTTSQEWARSNTATT